MFSRVTLTSEKMQTLRLPKAEASEEELYEIEDQIFNRKLSQEERDALLDKDAEDNQNLDQNIRRVVRKDGAVQSMALLVLLSSLMKHTELIPSEKKKSVLEHLLDGWNEFTLTSLILIPAMASKKRFWFGGIEYRLNFPDSMGTDEVARRLFLSMPVSTARTAFLNMGSEKLRNLLAVGIGREDEPLERQLLRFCILADLKLPGTADLAQTISTELYKNRYLANVLLTKLHDSMIRLRVPEDEVEEFRHVAANLIVSLSGDKGVRGAERRGRVINYFKRQEVVLRLKYGGAEG